MNAVNKSGRKMDGLPAVIPIISSKQPPLLFETRLHLSYETTVILHFRRLFVSAWPLQNVHALVVLLSVKYVFLVSSLLLSLLTSKTVEKDRQINYRHQLYAAPKCMKHHDRSQQVISAAYWLPKSRFLSRPNDFKENHLSTVSKLIKMLHILKLDYNDTFLGTLGSFFDLLNILEVRVDEDSLKILGQLGLITLVKKWALLHIDSREYFN